MRPNLPEAIITVPNDYGPAEAKSSVAVEDTIELFVNKLHTAAILATPEMLKELAIGYLICEGIVKTRERASSGSLVGPNRNRATIKININSDVPIIKVIYFCFVL